MLDAVPCSQADAIKLVDMSISVPVAAIGIYQRSDLLCCHGIGLFAISSFCLPLPLFPFIFPNVIGFQVFFSSHLIILNKQLFFSRIWSVISRLLSYLLRILLTFSKTLTLVLSLAMCYWRVYCLRLTFIGKKKRFGIYSLVINGHFLRSLISAAATQDSCFFFVLEMFWCQNWFKSQLLSFLLLITACSYWTICSLERFSFLLFFFFIFFLLLHHNSRHAVYCL